MNEIMAKIVLILSGIATVFTCSILIPQLIKTWKSGSAKDISYGMVIINIIQSIFWISATVLGIWFAKTPNGFGTGIQGLVIPLIVTNIISASCAITLGILKNKFSKKIIKNKKVTNTPKKSNKK